MVKDYTEYSFQNYVQRFEKREKVIMEAVVGRKGSKEGGQSGALGQKEIPYRNGS